MSGSGLLFRGHPDLPMEDGEPFAAYLERLAKHLGYRVQEPEPKRGRREQGQSFEAFLDALWSKKPGEERQPGEEG